MLRTNKHRIVLGLVAAAALAAGITQADETPDLELNTALMQSTFQIMGPVSPGKRTFGTFFVLVRPFPEKPKEGRFVLVTAAHILKKIQGEFATVMFRRKLGHSGWQQLPLRLRIREGNNKLWKAHPNADVAVMYISMPEGFSESKLGTTMLVEDAWLAEYELHPGDELNCLGYPLGAQANPFGFPILRSGKIASYPLLPTSETKVFLFDFEVFPGNSGGPVYLVQEGRYYGGKFNLGTRIHAIVGLVSQDRSLTEKTEGVFSTEERRYPLGIALVVHASLIKETIRLLPSPETPEAQSSTIRPEPLPQRSNR